MFYTNEMIINLGYKNQKEFADAFIFKHKCSVIRFDSNGVYADYDWYTSPCVSNIGYCYTI